MCGLGFVGAVAWSTRELGIPQAAVEDDLDSELAHAVDSNLRDCYADRHSAQLLGLADRNQLCEVHERMSREAEGVMARRLRDKNRVA